ncbi:MAG: type I DNA topoisomerase [Patescibacteria group bacterium]
MDLIIVESPTKSKTLQSFLGKDYKVLSSFGHVRDLPKGELGVDVENNFEPKYIVPTKAKKTVSLLKKESSSADSTILATDEDREGEAIAWHLAEALKLKNPKRIVFHEITKEAIQKALKNPRSIDINMVNAQQARRILDRIVGYKLSPFLWKKVAKGLSAGRVQSVAVKFVVDREREIEKFIPQEYWSVEAALEKNKKEFTAFLAKKNKEPITRLEIKNKKEADKILEDLKNANYVIENVEKKETKKNPFPPFTTSALQQSAWQRFHFPAKTTMQTAQRLYEQGFISYHRTDSLNLSETSLFAAKKFIAESFGINYWAGKLIRYKANKNAQEAHEAIRPTIASRTPESLKNTDSRQLKLYTIIWQRFIACQMSPALFDSVSSDIKANNYTFRANGQTLKFDGFLKIYPVKFEEKELPGLEKNDNLNLIKLTPSQHFTEPPARYTEASLIKILEKNGIGRPSTYAPTLSTIQERNYVAKNDQKRFFPNEMGIIVNDILAQNFPQIVDIDFTAKMEKELDEIAEKKDTWIKTCKDFYVPFAKNLEEKYKEVKKENTDIKTDKICPRCAKPMVEKLGRFGRFYACAGFPDCKYTESLESVDLGIICPRCKVGKIVVRKSKRGKIFYGCDLYPKCDFALWDKPVNEFCKKCGSILVETKNKQIKCGNKECKQSTPSEKL